MDPFSRETVQSAYDQVAADYTVAFGDTLRDLPLDCEMLDAALAAAGDGWVLEAGCGPAPAADYLADRDPQLLGLDLSMAMLAVAGSRNPALPLVQADLRAIPLRDGSCALVIAYYSLQHLPRVDVGTALAELGRVLRIGGVLVVAAHLGDGDVLVEEFLGHQISGLGGVLLHHDELVDLVCGAGFRIDTERQRGPEPHEYDSQRLYLLARREA